MTNRKAMMKEIRTHVDGEYSFVEEKVEESIPRGWRSVKRGRATLVAVRYNPPFGKLAY
jgi:hypothetical protein